MAIIYSFYSLLLNRKLICIITIEGFIGLWNVDQLEFLLLTPLHFYVSSKKLSLNHLFRARVLFNVL